MVKKNSDFDHFVEGLKFAYTLFCFSVKLDEKFAGKKDVDKKDLVLFWSTYRVSLKRSYLAELAKIFEKPSTRFDEVLSIYWLLDFEFKDHEKTIDNLKKLRNKLLMHNDLETLRDLNAFMKSINLSPKDIESLFKKVIDVVEKIRTQYGIHGEVKYKFDGVEKQTDKEVTFLLAKTRKS